MTKYSDKFGNKDTAYLFDDLDNRVSLLESSGGGGDGGVPPALTAQVDKNTVDIAQNTADISTNSTDIAENKASIIQNSADIAHNTTDISTANSQITQLLLDVSSLSTSITQNTAQITINTTSINQNTNDIADLVLAKEDLQSQIDNINTALANVYTKAEIYGLVGAERKAEYEYRVASDTTFEIDGTIQEFPSDETTSVGFFLTSRSAQGALINPTLTSTQDKPSSTADFNISAGAQVLYHFRGFFNIYLPSPNSKIEIYIGTLENPVLLTDYTTEAGMTDSIIWEPEVNALYGDITSIYYKITSADTSSVEFSPKMSTSTGATFILSASDPVVEPIIDLGFSSMTLQKKKKDV